MKLQRPRKRRGQPFWPKIVLRKWLNISNRESDFSADDELDTGSDLEYEDTCSWERDAPGVDKRLERLVSNVSASENTPYKSRRRKSETFRSQYINTKELRICVGTWNAGGILPPDDLEIGDWLNIDDPADIYVLGLQEIVPLNAGNVLGAEDSSPVPRWESMIRETLNRFRPEKTGCKCHSDPPSPSRFKPSDDAFDAEDDISSESDSDGEAEIHPLDDDLSYGFDIASEANIANESDFDQIQKSNITDESVMLDQQKQSVEYSPKRLDRLNQFSFAKFGENLDISTTLPRIKLRRTLSTSEKIGLSWPEQPLNLSGQISLGSSNSFDSVTSFKASPLFKYLLGDSKVSIKTEFVPEHDRLNSIVSRRKRSAYVKLVSKQMVGIFISIWVHRRLRKHIQNLKVSTVGVGVMGYIGNKGSISVSMSIYQTLFCFICSHLTSGEKNGDELRRNADVQEIHRRTKFNSVPGISLPRTILDHERIIWFGDLNYRINLPYGITHELIGRNEWPKLAEMDQLTRELRKGRVFDGWTEGVLDFPPTYKYEINSGEYTREEPKAGRRTPAWCDRILSYGKGITLMNYRRSELRLSDHRPVVAKFTVEVEVFCHRKLQKALTFTDAELEDCGIISEDAEIHCGLNHLRLVEW